MRWYLGAILLLVVALAFGLSLLAYAMYALLGVMLVSRAISRAWITNLSAARECNRLTANIGERIAVVRALTEAADAERAATQLRGAVDRAGARVGGNRRLGTRPGAAKVRHYPRPGCDLPRRGTA